MTKRYLPLLFGFVAVTLLHADGPGDNRPEKVRAGASPRHHDRPDRPRRTARRRRCLGKDIERLRQDLKDKARAAGTAAGRADLPQRRPLRPDLRRVLRPDEVAVARKLLDQGTERAEQLREGKAPWTTATGLVVRGYSRRSTARCSPMAWSCRRRIRPNSPTSIASTSGATAAARR